MVMRSGRHMSPTYIFYLRSYKISSFNLSYIFAIMLGKMFLCLFLMADLAIQCLTPAAKRRLSCYWCPVPLSKCYRAELNFVYPNDIMIMSMSLFNQIIVAQETLMLLSYSFPSLSLSLQTKARLMLYVRVASTSCVHVFAAEARRPMSPIKHKNNIITISKANKESTNGLGLPHFTMALLLQARPLLLFVPVPYVCYGLRVVVSTAAYW